MQVQTQSNGNKVPDSVWKENFPCEITLLSAKQAENKFVSRGVYGKLNPV